MSMLYRQYYENSKNTVILVILPPLVEVNENFNVSVGLSVGWSGLSHVYPTHFFKNVVMA
jgi:hypothetical protein